MVPRAVRHEALALRVPHDGPRLKAGVTVWGADAHRVPA